MWVTPPLGTRGPAVAASTYPHSLFGLVARVERARARESERESLPLVCTLKLIRTHQASHAHLIPQGFGHFSTRALFMSAFPDGGQRGEREKQREERRERARERESY